jgi:hypothetical protein
MQAIGYDAITRRFRRERQMVDDSAKKEVQSDNRQPLAKGTR